jgi:hypothetical protein
MSLLDPSYETKHLFRTKQMTVVDIQPNVAHGGLFPISPIHEVGFSCLIWKEVIVSSRKLNVAFFNLLSSEYQANIPRCKAARF